MMNDWQDIDSSATIPQTEEQLKRQIDNLNRFNELEKTFYEFNLMAVSTKYKELIESVKNAYEDYEIVYEGTLCPIYSTATEKICDEKIYPFLRSVEKFWSYYEIGAIDDSSVRSIHGYLNFTYTFLKDFIAEDRKHFPTAWDAFEKIMNKAGIKILALQE